VTRDEALRLVTAATAAAAADPASDIVWAGTHEGKPGIRVRQTCREATTVWFTVGERTVGFEAYLLPAPIFRPADVYRHCLVRAYRSWPASLAIGPDGGLFVIGRIPLGALTETSLDEVIAAVYEVVELSFLPLLDIGYRSREKSS
jgi:hypothetical protein